MADLQHDHVPDTTTPQGTMLHAVDHGHEATDLNFGAVIKWFGGLTAFALCVHLVVFGLIQLIPNENPINGSHMRPPPPRVLPDPIDSALHPAERQIVPAEAYQVERKKDEQNLADEGLWSPGSDRPLIPPADAAKVIDLQGAPLPLPKGVGVTQVPQPITPGNPTGTGDAAIPEGYAPQPEPLGPESGGTGEFMPSGPSGGTAVESRLR